jgi:hypothetical protein
MRTRALSFAKRENVRENRSVVELRGVEIKKARFALGVTKANAIRAFLFSAKREGN